jgi:uncharacterized protein (UPF0212 family)
MAILCACGGRMPYLFDDLGCIECGRTCCPDCAVLMESAWYCARCADSLLQPHSLEVGREGAR